MGKSRRAINQVVHSCDLKIVLVSITVSVIVVVCVSVYLLSLQDFGYDHRDQVTPENGIPNSGILMDIGGLKYISSQDGVKQWILKAGYMCMDNKMGKSFVYNPEIDFFLNSNEIFYLSAKSGLIDHLSNSISTFGAVCIHAWDVIVETDYAEYDSNSFSLISKRSTVLFDNNFSVQSDSLVINLKNGLFQFNGNVKSEFDNTSY